MEPTPPQQINTQTYLYVIKTNMMHYLSSVYFVSQPLHVSGIFVAHHQEVYCIMQQSVHVLFYWPVNRQSTKMHNSYQLLYIHSIPPDDGLQICPKHVEVDWRNKLRLNSASSWFSLHECIEMKVNKTKCRSDVKNWFLKTDIQNAVGVIFRIQTSVAMACFLLFKLDRPVPCSGIATAHREEGQNVRPQHVAVNIVQLVGSEICVNIGGVEV